MALAASEAAPLFFPLGDLPGGAFVSFADDVSDDGSVVVGESEGPDGSEAFRWTRDGGMQGLGPAPDGGASGALGVSADGAVVVGGGDTPSGSGGLRWTEQGGVQALESPGNFGVAYATSADGSVTVGYSGLQALRWSDAFGAEWLGNVAGGNQAIAYGVSADGNVVVGSAMSSGGRQAFRWTRETGMVGLGDFPGGVFDSVASAVSADGSTIVGVGSKGNAPAVAFRWTAETGLEELSLGPGAPNSVLFSGATDVSADGSIIVGSIDAPSTGSMAVIWDPIHGMRSLSQILTDAGVNLGGIDLRGASAISADGMTIVGTGVDANLRPEGWLVILPEPNTAFLLSFGLVAIGSARESRRAA